MTIKASLLSPDAGDVIFSVKTFAAGSLALWIAFAFDLPHPYWAITTAYIVAHPLSGASTSKAVYRLAGTVMGGTATIVFVPNLINAPQLLVLAISLWIAGCLALSLLDRTPRGYAYMLAGYTAALTSFPIVSAPDTAFTYVVARVTEISVAIICTSLINRTIFPRHAGPVLVGRVEAWLKDGVALATGVMRGGKDAGTLAAMSRALAADAIDIRGFTTHISYDTSHHRSLVSTSRELQRVMVELLPVISGLADVIAALSRASGGAPTAEIRDLLDRICLWMEAGQPMSEEERRSFLDTFEEVETQGCAISAWNGMLVRNLVARLRDLVQLWGDCIDLKDTLKSGRQHRRRWLRFGGQAENRPMHRDYGMALFSGFAAALATGTGAAFWILTGWPHGAGMGMMAGILTCFFAAMDNATPILKKFLIFTLVSIGGTFVFQFAVMPHVNGFLPLILALSFLFIPLGLLIARPQTFLLGMAMSTNIPNMIGLESRASFDLATFINSNIGTPLGIVLAIGVATLVRSVGAEWSAARLMRAGWRDVSMAARTHDRDDFSRLLHQMLDRLGLIGPRLAAIPANSPVTAQDLLKDLRVGVNVIELQRRKEGLTGRSAESVDAILTEIAAFYDEKQRSAAAKPGPSMLRTLDCALLALQADSQSAPAAEAAINCVALRYNLLPEAAEFAASETNELREAAE
ncbi:FUSC family protein [Sinorhizobium sp. BG8]|uniref:FUSC family protein n=1 Tax=Sinorhizobium sp. BG8 TaxID=2613773 RepID=UPI00193DD912|nr:FUSC family protein [Sinorhizobium sp. BG8]QRM53206.1 FUSC family protein [Sinorhizobium sp. BG8]